MVVDAQLGGAGEQLGAEIARRLERHVAAAAIRLGLRRVVEAARAVPRNAAQQERIVMVLAAEEFLVVVQRQRQVHLVAGRAELGRAVKVLQERLLVERRLGLDELIVDPLQQRVVAERERVVQRLFDRVVGVAARAVDVA